MYICHKNCIIIAKRETSSMQKFDYDSIIDNFLASTKNIKPASNRLFSIALPINIKNLSLIIDNINTKKNDFILFSVPSENKTFIGIDILWELKGKNSSSKTKHKSIESIIENKFTNFASLSLREIPIVFSSVKFEDTDKNDIWKNFNKANWVIPRFLFCKTESGTFLIINFFQAYLFETAIYSSFFYLLDLLRVTHKSFINGIIKIVRQKSAFERWEKQVEELLVLIRKKEFRKVVLSRRVEYELLSEISLTGLICNLEKKFPDTTIFMINRKGSIFFGATPELLIKLDHRKIFTEALAGSAPRGKSVDEDKIFANDLLNSKKNRVEQKFVTDYIVDSLSNLVKNIHFNKTPEIKKLSNIQHLRTKISGLVKSDVSIFDLINAIYPTPAICGIPTAKAKKKIHAIEKYNRGLYSGVIGWIDEKLEGSFYVAIRSALIDERNLYVFAGCGIVDGSNAKSEFDETKLKLNPILSLFNEKAN